MNALKVQSDFWPPSTHAIIPSHYISLLFISRQEKLVFEMEATWH